MKYSMAQVKILTGIKAHTLRIWERRYNFLKPDRTNSNIRYYSDEQLRMLLSVDTLNRNGYRISQIDKMSIEEINNQVIEIFSKDNTENKDEINALTSSMLGLNEEGFNKVFQRRVMRSGLLSTVTELIYPFLTHIGILWGASKTSPAQEHFISNLIRQKIISAIEMIPIPSFDAPKILFFLPEGEDHEIGLLLASFIAKDLGWHTYYLGQNVPTDNIKNTIEIAKPDLMMTILVTPRADKPLQSIYEISKAEHIPLLISGNTSSFSDKDFSSGINRISNPEDFIFFLKNFIHK